MANEKRNVESERRIEKMVADPRDIGETRTLKKLPFHYEKKRRRKKGGKGGLPYE